VLLPPRSLPTRRSSDLGHIPHFLISGVRKCHCWSNGDRIPGMNTHGIHVLNGTNNDHIVIGIPQEFQFVFLPSQNSLIDQYLMRSEEHTSELQSRENLV